MASAIDDPQRLSIEEVRKVYSETVASHATSPRNMGSLSNADGFASMTGPCGDTIELWLKVNSRTISGATFSADGCAATVACGSIITELVKGKTVAEAQRIGQTDIVDALDGLPDGNHHCALLAANTIKAAVTDYVAMEREPWKKAYRNR